jgi:iron complex outermembrane receptor protein
MTRSRKRKLLRVHANKAWMPLASALLAGAPMVHAQVAETAELGEILVTAQKRTEDVQKVPISMQVLGGEKLQQLQVNSFDDYAKFLPSVSFQSLGPGQAQLYFRGITSGVNGGSILHAGSTSATGVYLDETPITTIANSPDLHVYDIQRVEALAGPQGTLYGASSLSGTLRIITNKPDPTAFSAGYDVKGDKFHAGNGGGEFEGFVNIPISEHAAVRLVGYYEHDGGYISNVPASRTYSLATNGGTAALCNNPTSPLNGQTAATCPITITNAAYVNRNFNDADTFGGRAALKVDLNDRWTVTPLIVYQNLKTNGNFTYDPKIGYLQVTDFTPDYTQDHWYQTALTIEGKISDYDLVYSGGYFERNTEIASDYSEYSIAYDYHGYSRFRNSQGQLIDPTQAQKQVDSYTKMTHEVRISSPATDVVHFVAGLFYQRQTDKIRDEYLIPGLGNSTQYDYSVPGQSPNLYLTQQERVDRDYAAFLDLTWNISDQWKLSAGIRGFVARNTLDGFFGFNNAFVDTSNGDNFSHGSGTTSCLTPVVTTSNLPCINTNAGVREAGQTHRVNLTYQIDPSRMVYATYSTGFRPGGVNRREGIAPYDSDTLTNYEVGWKTAWLDHTLRFNGAIFYEQWNGVQLGVNGPNGITDYWNIGNAVSKGLESDIDWLVWEHLDLTLGGTYVNANTTTPFCGENATHTGVLSTCTDPAAPSGTRLPVTPELKANLIARYKFEYAGYKMFTQAAVLHQSSSNADLYVAQETAVGTVPGFTSVDLSVGMAKNTWNMELYLDNALDTRGELNRQSMCAAGNSYCYDHYRVYPIKPQMLGIKFGNKF